MWSAITKMLSMLSLYDAEPTQNEGTAATEASVISTDLTTSATEAYVDPTDLDPSATEAYVDPTNLDPSATEAYVDPTDLDPPVPEISLLPTSVAPTEAEVSVVPTESDTQASLPATTHNPDNTLTPKSKRRKTEAHFVPTSGLLRALLRHHGLQDAGLPLEQDEIPPTLVRSLELEAIAILEGTSPVNSCDEQRDFLSAFAIVGKCFPVAPCIGAAKAQLALALQNFEEERDEVDAATFEEIVSIPPVDIPTTSSHSQPLESFTIPKCDVTELMSTQSKAPPIIFQNNPWPKNHLGFPHSDFSTRLNITRRDVLDKDIPHLLTTAACVAVAAFNSTLTGEAASTGPLIAPVKHFKQSILDIGKIMVGMVKQHTDFSHGPRRKIKARLEMEVKMRCLVATHFLDLCLLIVEPATPLDIDTAGRIRQDFIGCFQGLYFMSFLEETFPHLFIRD